MTDLAYEDEYFDEEDYPYCTCEVEHSMDEEDSNQCDACGKPID